MRKFFTPKTLLLSVIFFITLTSFSVVALTQTNDMCVKAPTESCLRTPSEGTGEMLWDVISRRLGTFISIQ